MFDVDEINKEIPYKISVKEYGCVSFTTDNKLTYNVLFLSLYPNDSYNLHNINFYDLTVEVIGKNKRDKRNNKIKETILRVVSFFMKEFDDVVLLIYDNSDGKGKIRLHLFKSWFDDLYYKKDYDDFSFMTNKNYQKKEEVENIFDCYSLDCWDYQL